MIFCLISNTNIDMFVTKLFLNFLLHTYQEHLCLVLPSLFHSDRQFHLNSGLSHHANGSYSSPDTQNPNLSWNMGPKNKLELPISSVTRPSSYLPLSSLGLNQNLASTQLHNRSSPTLSDKEFNSFPNILLPPSTQSMHLPVRRVASEESSTSSAPSLEFGNLLTPSSTPAVNIESGYSSSKPNIFHALFDLHVNEF